MRFSIIINNYNYARFVGQAIESALAVGWEDKETIVVDDGSTDDSRAVIAAYENRIVPVFTANGGQAQAANTGFARSTGEVVIFLDADDMLLPTIAQRVMAAWGPAIAKVQYGMIYVDEALHPLGREWPAYTAGYTPETVSRLMRETGAYLSPPTSGNAWGRNFLQEVFPLPTRDQGLHWIDMYLQKLAPFFGDVVSLTTPQCLYRRHGGNLWDYGVVPGVTVVPQFLYRRHGGNDSGFVRPYQHLARYPALVTQVETVRKLGDELLRSKGRDASIGDGNEYHSKVVLVAKRFFPGRYPERLTTLLMKYWQTAIAAEAGLMRRALLVVWGLAVAAAPRPLAGWIVLHRDSHAMANAKSLRRIAGRAVLRGWFNG
jgi:hypothetical protein